MVTPDNRNRSSVLKLATFVTLSALASSSPEKDSRAQDQLSNATTMPASTQPITWIQGPSTGVVSKIQQQIIDLATSDNKGVINPKSFLQLVDQLLDSEVGTHSPENAKDLARRVFLKEQYKKEILRELLASPSREISNAIAAELKADPSYANCDWLNELLSRPIGLKSQLVYLFKSTREGKPNEVAISVQDPYPKEELPSDASITTRFAFAFLNQQTGEFEPFIYNNKSTDITFNGLSNAQIIPGMEDKLNEKSVLRVQMFYAQHSTATTLYFTMIQLDELKGRRLSSQPLIQIKESDTVAYRQVSDVPFFLHKLFEEPKEAVVNTAPAVINIGDGLDLLRNSKIAGPFEAVSWDEADRAIYPNVHVVTAAGKLKSRADFVLIKKGAGWCGPCKLATPKLSQLQEDAGRDLLEVFDVIDGSKFQEDSGGVLKDASHMGPNKDQIAIQTFAAVTAESASKFARSGIPEFMLIWRAHPGEWNVEDGIPVMASIGIDSSTTAPKVPTAERLREFKKQLLAGLPAATQPTGN